MDHEQTTIDTLLHPHFLATEVRVRAEAIVLAVQDTTSLNYTAHAATEGMGTIASIPISQTRFLGATGQILKRNLVKNDGLPILFGSFWGSKYPIDGRWLRNVTNDHGNRRHP